MSETTYVPEEGPRDGYEAALRDERRAWTCFQAREPRIAKAISEEANLLGLRGDDRIFFSLACVARAVAVIKPGRQDLKTRARELIRCAIEAALRGSP